jgi:hypothetical protein
LGLSPALVFTGEKNGRCRELGVALSGEYNAESGTFPESLFTRKTKTRSITFAYKDAYGVTVAAFNSTNSRAGQRSE